MECTSNVEFDEKSYAVVQFPNLPHLISKSNMISVSFAVSYTDES